MREKPIFPLILKMALPMVVSMLVNALYNIVDGMFVSQASEIAMTAISLVFPLQNLANAAGIGFGVGINAAVAYYLGSQKKAAADRAATLGLLLSVLHGVVLAILCLSAIEPFLRLFTKSEETVAYGLDYFYIVIAFAPILTADMALEKILQATGKMKTTMFCMAIGALVNIVLDPVFIRGAFFVPAMGVKGAAVATGIGQVVTLFSYIVVYACAKIPVNFRLGRRSDEKICRKLYAVGVPAFLNLALPSFTVTFLNAVLVSFSETYVFILGVYYKLQTFLYFTLSGIVQGVRPLVGYNYGAGRQDRVTGIFKVSLFLGVVVMIAGTVVCFVIPERLMSIFTDSEQAIEEGALALRIIGSGFIVSAFSVVIGGFFEGLGKGMPSLVISLLRYVAILPVALCASFSFGAIGVWHAFWITEVFAALCACLLFYFCYVKTISPKRGKP